MLHHDNTMLDADRISVQVTDSFSQGVNGKKKPHNYQRKARKSCQCIHLILVSCIRRSWMKLEGIKPE